MTEEPIKPRTLNFLNLDPDYRYTPKSLYYCIVCQKDLKTKKRMTPFRFIYIINNSDLILHPKDAHLLPKESYKSYLVGRSCLKKAGANWDEWSVRLDTKI